MMKRPNRRVGDISENRLRVSARALSAMSTTAIVVGYIALGDYMAAVGLCGCAGLALTGGLTANASKPN